MRHRDTEIHEGPEVPGDLLVMWLLQVDWLHPSNTTLIQAEDIGKLPDKNIADSLQRVPGVNTVSAASGEGVAFGSMTGCELTFSTDCRETHARQGSAIRLGGIILF